MAKLPIDKKKKQSKTRCKKTTATRKIKAGLKTVIDQDTGAERRVTNFEIKDIDFNWNKIWLGHLLDCLEVIGNKKIQIMTWLLENRNEKDNLIYATQRMIALETGASLPTVTETLTLMQDQNVLDKKRNGVYQLNPNLIFQGNSEQRMDILLSYKKTNTIDGKSKEEKSKEIGDSDE
jgi:hypothetical protein